MPINSVHPRDFDAIEHEEERDMLSLWLPVVAHGIVITALGIVAVAVPTVSTYATEIVIGLAFLTAGIVGIMAVLATRHIPGLAWLLLSGALLVLSAGVLLLWQPSVGVLSLTMLLIALFATQGLTAIVLATLYRGALGQGWGWVVVSGLVDVALAVLLWSGWPGTASWAIGLLVGINMISTGLALLVIGLGARRLSLATPEA